MQEQEIELSIGDCLQIGAHTVTLVDIEGGEVSFRIDHNENSEQVILGAHRETAIPR